MPAKDRTEEIKRFIEGCRKSLLDLSRRNRLIYFHTGFSTKIQIMNPTVAGLYQTVALDERTLEFPYAQGMTLDEIHAAEASQTPQAQLPIVTEDLQVEPPISTFDDLRRLHGRLERLRRDTRTIFEEQGINTLFLALGILEWREAENTQEIMRSPLVLVPAALERKEDRYVLGPHDDDLEVNPVLRYRLLRDFGIEIPDLESQEEQPGVEALQELLREIRNRISSRGWKVVNEAWLSQFSFQKLVMYRDLEGPKIVEQVVRHPIVSALCGEPLTERLREVDLRTVEETIERPEVFPVLETDSSQLEVLDRARRGETLVVQGPPGTGKSQTIVNIISQAIRDGKKVLFVSEKRAALDVVYNRLKQLGLHRVCLELHSHAANRKAVVEELLETLEVMRNWKSPPSSTVFDEYSHLRRQLDRYVVELHQPRDRSGRTAYQIHGRLLGLKDVPLVSSPLPFESTLDLAPSLESRITQLLREIGQSRVWLREDEHPWRDVSSADLASIMPDLIAQVCGEGAEVSELISRVIQTLREVMGISLATACELKQTQRILELLLERPPGQVREDWLWSSHQTGGRFLQRLFDAARQLFNKRYRWARRFMQLSVEFPPDQLRRLATKEPTIEFRHRVKTSLHEVFQAKEAFAKIMSSELLRAIFPTGPRGIDFDQIPIDELTIKFRAWEKEANRLQEWCNHLALLQQAEQVGIAEFLHACRKAQVAGHLLERTFWRAYLLRWLSEAYRQAPILASFDPHRWEDIRARFRVLDRQLQKEAVLATLHSVASRLPQPLPLNEEGRLRREAAKKRRHLPLRRLFPQIPTLLLALKPCLMMSPLSVATYLPKEVFKFDLAVFDEASQLLPGDAIGVLLRAKQAVIFGDNKQLPPTDFFQSHVEGSEEEEGALDYESILDIASASFSNAMLRWHYRSRDERLIAFSNRRFYGGKLITFPAPILDSTATGVRLVFVPDGVYGRGGSRTNLPEARKVAQLVLEHFLRSPQRSIGVVAMSIEQRDVIDDTIRRILRMNGVSVPHNDAEPFFVKNLETVQGDERDVVILSLGYGPNEPGGKVTFQFGPLNRQGGERRWNVAITRARDQLIVVSSIKPGQLAGIHTRWEGPRLVAEYLDYAARGGFTIVSKSGDPESEFEEAVREALVARGYDVDCQVGVSGYRIDLGVRDPANPHRYLAGVECDGATYHSARTTRDRDRIRQEVLERLGWRLIRVWSADWLRDPEGSIARLVAELERIRTASSQPSSSAEGFEDRHFDISLHASTNMNPESRENTEPTTVIFPPYECYDPIKSSQMVPPHKAPLSIAELIRDVVRGESPVHVRRVTDLVRQFCGRQRLGRRARAMVEDGILRAEGAG